MKIIDNKFNFEDIVYIVTDPDQRPHLVTGIALYPNGENYRVSRGGVDMWVYEFELSAEKNVLVSSIQ